MRSINDALTAAPDLFHQFVVAEFSQHRRSARCFVAMSYWRDIIACKLVHMAGLISRRRGYGGRVDPRYKCVRKYTKATLEKTTWAASFWRVGWDFRAAL